MIRAGLLAVLLVGANAQHNFSGIPRDAEIIETADLSPIVKNRAIILWMPHPARHFQKFDLNRNGGDCSDPVHGDFGKHWEGATRLSLVDSRQSTLINTIEVKHNGEDSLVIPLCLPGGRHNLDLRDLTGRGFAADLVLSVFLAYTLADTAVFGYDPKSDRIEQFLIEIDNGAQKRTVPWTEQVFAMDPIRAGYWNFKWRPGHGYSMVCSEEVHFDRARDLFVQKQRCNRK